MVGICFLPLNNDMLSFFYLVPCFSPFKHLFYIGYGDGFLLFLLLSVFPLILVLYGEGFSLFLLFSLFPLILILYGDGFLLFLLLNNHSYCFLLLNSCSNFSSPLLNNCSYFFFPFVSQHIKNKPLFDWLALNLF